VMVFRVGLEGLEDSVYFRPLFLVEALGMGKLVSCSYQRSRYVRLHTNILPEIHTGIRILASHGTLHQPRCNEAKYEKPTASHYRRPSGKKQGKYSFFFGGRCKKSFILASLGSTLLCDGYLDCQLPNR